MKLISLTLIVLISAFAGFSQTNKGTKQVTSKKISKKIVSIDAYSTVSFDLDIKSLPPYFIGHNARLLYEKLLPLAVEANSGCRKFEKSNECQTRLNQLYERKFWNGLTPDDLFAFSISVECGYNADTAEMSCPEFSPGFKYYTWSHNLIESKTYIGQNVFGVKKPVIYRKFENIHIEDNDYLPNLKVQNIQPDEARKVINNMKLLLTGKFVSPFVRRDIASYKPTIDEPIHTEGINKYLSIEIEEIWLYDFVTGKIYRKN